MCAELDALGETRTESEMCGHRIESIRPNDVSNASRTGSSDASACQMVTHSFDGVIPQLYFLIRRCACEVWNQTEQQ